MKSNEKFESSSYVKPELVVYGDFAKVTKMTGAGMYTDAAFTARTPVPTIIIAS